MNFRTCLIEFKLTDKIIISVSPKKSLKGLFSPNQHLRKLRRTWIQTGNKPLSKMSLGKAIHNNLWLLCFRNTNRISNYTRIWPRYDIHNIHVYFYSPRRSAVHHAIRAVVGTSRFLAILTIFFSFLWMFIIFPIKV